MRHFNINDYQFYKVDVACSNNVLLTRPGALAVKYVDLWKSHEARDYSIFLLS